MSEFCKAAPRDRCTLSGQVDGERRELGRRRAADRPAVRRHDLARDGQAEPRAAPVRRTGRVETVELLENDP